MDTKKEKRQITKSEDTARLALQSEIQSLIDNGCDARPWLGSRPIVNPSTGEEVGTRPTFNINLSVEKPLFDRVNKALELLANTGAYIEGQFGDTKMIATKAYPQDRSGSVINVIQFALPNQSATMKTNEDDFKIKIREMVAQVSTVSAKAKTEVVKENLPF